MTAARDSTAGTILFVLFGPIVWSLHLLIVYGGHASLCVFDMTRLLGLPIVPILLIAGTLGPLALLAAVLVRPAPLRALLKAAGGGSDASWLQHLMRLLCGLSAVAVLYSGVAILMVPYCAQLR
jgi:hypothetical protein